MTTGRSPPRSGSRPSPGRRQHKGLAEHRPAPVRRQRRQLGQRGRLHGRRGRNHGALLGPHGVRGHRGHLDRRRARVDARYATARRRANTIVQLPHQPRRADAVPHRGARLRASGQSIADVRALRGEARLEATPRSTTRGSRILDPITQQRDPLPAVRASSPASTPATTSSAPSTRRRPTRWCASRIGFETLLNKAQQEVLNPEGINCFRFFEGRGFRLWGARTISSDPEWKYVNLRRYFAYLEHSIDKGTQWAVFEPNGERAVGQRAPHGRGLPLQRVADRRAARRQAGEGLLRQLRPLDHDAERPR